MTLTLLCLALQEPQLDAATVVSRMLTRYHQAVSVVGRIQLTQSFRNTRVVVRSVLQYEKPSKFYLLQNLEASEPKTSLVTSDGKFFSYNVPELPFVAGQRRLVEAVDQNGKLLDVRDIYQASVRSLVDRSAPLDIAVSRRDDLAFLRDQWMDLQVQKQEADFVVSGKWREFAGQAVTGTLQMVISPEYDLKVYEIRERRQFAYQGQRTEPDTLVSRWDVALKVDAPADPKLFTLVR